MNNISSNNQSPPLLADKSIYIIGPRRLQNELLALFLERETGAKCIECKDLSHIQAINDNDEDSGDQSNLILLVDCREKDPENPLNEFESVEENTLPAHFLALFNVNPALGIEKRSLRQGIRGFFYENDPLELFPKGLRAIFDGELWASREIMTRFVLEDKGEDIVHRQDVTILTPREIEIVSMVAAGAKNEDIADKLCISPHTVKTHIYNIFKKIDVPNRLQAALWAAKHL